jgi:hypothetical protein
MKLSCLFKFLNAKSKGFEEYPSGDIAFVTNGFRNNGVVGYVTPLRGDRVFHFEGICISAFCEATVQKPPFLPRGNGGSGLLVLEPRESMALEELMKVASYINSVHGWRFSYGRMVNVERVKDLEINLDFKPHLDKTVQEIIPHHTSSRLEFKNIKFKLFNITDFFTLERGHFHALDRLKEGPYTTVSRVAEDNGVVGFFGKPKNAKAYPGGTITVATTSGDAFVQLNEFIATDNVVILIPKTSFSVEDLFFIACMINRERWRVSYGRQCYKAIFAKTNIFMPVNDDGSLDHEYMRTVVSNSYNFRAVKSFLESACKGYRV